MRPRTIMQTTIGKTDIRCVVEVYAVDPPEFGFLKPDLITPDPVRRGMARPEDIARIEDEIRKAFGKDKDRVSETPADRPRSWSKIPTIT